MRQSHESTFVPKFGQWDENALGSGEIFTGKFKRVEEEKLHTAPVKFPFVQVLLQSTTNHQASQGKKTRRVLLSLHVYHKRNRFNYISVMRRQIYISIGIIFFFVMCRNVCWLFWEANVGVVMQQMLRESFKFEGLLQKRFKFEIFF